MRKAVCVESQESAMCIPGHHMPTSPPPATHTTSAELPMPGGPVTADRQGCTGASGRPKTASRPLASANKQCLPAEFTPQGCRVKDRAAPRRRARTRSAQTPPAGPWPAAPPAACALGSGNAQWPPCCLQPAHGSARKHSPGAPPPHSAASTGCPNAKRYCFSS